MVPELFSAGLPEYSQQITNGSLLTSLRQLKDYLSLDQLEIKEWDEERIAVRISVDVNIPPLGNAFNLDIRSQEPILLVFNLKNYPENAPGVYPDRIDFPKDKLGHLYVAVNGKPPGFCLVRGDLDEWYGNKQIKDLFIRIENWLRDAVTGELNIDGGQFEPLRLENYSGSLQYNYDSLADVVKTKASYIDGSNFSKILWERVPAHGGLSWKYLKIVTKETLTSVYKEIVDEETKVEGEIKRNLYFGYIVWSNSDNTIGSYNVDLPLDWKSFVQFCVEYDIDTTGLVAEVVSTIELRAYVSIPIVVAIRRPFPIIGFSECYEFVNFHVYLPKANIVSGNIKEESELKFKQHKQPLTPEKASTISGYIYSSRKIWFVAGAGALGSKIVLHLARSGVTNFWIADKDNLMPHNFVRHALSSADVNLNKAKALENEIKRLYDQLPSATSPSGFAGNANLLLTLEAAYKHYEWVFDFTASPAFLNHLAKVKIDPFTRVCKSYISDFGNLGLLLFEGVSRNPRVDDLQILMYAKALESEDVEEWLNREAQAKNMSSSVTVGIGCNSETTILADEKVSIHAAAFASIIKCEALNVPNLNGVIYRNKTSDEPHFNIETVRDEFSPLTILRAINDSSWEIRISAGILNKLNDQLVAASPLETGGVFIGSANCKTKTIHVVGIIDAPADSKANEVCFFRGVLGLPEKIKEVTDKTGGQIGYIGEWHTHPEGPNGLSPVDIAAVRKFKDSYMTMPTPLPVFLIILTPDGPYPFVY